MDTESRYPADAFSPSPLPGGGIETPAPRRGRRRSYSLGFVVALLALGVVLGFSLGFVAAGSRSLRPVVLYDEAKVTALYEQASPAVVELVVQRGIQGETTGSGFLIDTEGYIATNNHVVSGVDTVMVRLYDGRVVEGRKLGTSPADDLALLKVDPQEVDGITPLELGDSDQVRPGQMVVAIGSPFRQFNSIGVGVVNGIGRTPRSVLLRPIPNMIQTDAALKPGNSGGPLLDSRGRVIGINSAVEVGLEGRLSVGFAVPINTLKDLLPELKKPGEFRRPWLGISGVALEELSPTVDLGVERGIYVNRVFPHSPAQRAGLRPGSLQRPGDIILAIDGRPVSSVADMVDYLNTQRPGDVVTLTVYRGGQTLDLRVTLDPWPDT